MKFLITLVTFVAAFSISAQAQTPIPKETANQYFENCIKIPPQENFSQESQNMFCACTAARMTQFFTVEDWNQIVQRGPKVREADNRMLVEVYAPCMEEPVRAHYYNTCISDPNSARYGNPQTICTCLGNQMGAHIQVSGQKIFREALAENPNISDPMAYLLSQPEFQRFAQTKLTSCVKR